MAIEASHSTHQNYSTVWALHLQPEGALLIDRQSLYYLRLSSLATELLLQFAHAGSLDNVVRVRSVVDNEDPSSVRQALQDILGGHPLTRQWLDGGVDSHIQVTGSTDCYVPVSLALQLTNGCNLTCPFCYASSGARRPEELEAGEWIAIITKLASRGTLTVTLTGGEPTLARGFREILIAASGLMPGVAVFTNGYSWSERLMDLVASLGNVDIQISVDGAPQRHDVIRGRPGAFARAMLAIEAFARRGVGVDVAMTATPANYGDVSAVAQAADQAGARLLRVGQVQSVGRANAGTDFILTTSQREAVESQLAEVERNTRKLETVPWSGCESTDELVAQTGFAPEFLVPGYLSWYVMSNGQVTPCQLEEVGVLGDVRNEAVEDLGSPDRLARVARHAGGCHCIPRVRPPTTNDLPYRLEPV